MFRAYDASRERLVAVKLFKLDLPPERGHQLVAEFERLISADLLHPALSTPLATGISGVSAYLAQDYVAADSLDLVVREYGPAPAGSALRVAAQLAGALDFAAAAHVTHGALHPRDVLLASDDTRLTGLGVTRALERIGVVAPVRRPYTAPERIAGGEWDRRTDVFGLAALMHELLWGRRVSGLGAQAVEGLTDIAGGDLAALQTVFARALAENPAERFGTALEFAEALRDACPDVAVASEPPPPAPKRRASRADEPRLPLDPLSLDEEPVELRRGFAMPETGAPVVEAKTTVTQSAAPPLVVEPGVQSAVPPDIEKVSDPEAAPAPPIDEPEIVHQAMPDLVHTATPYGPSTTIPAGLITSHDSEPLSALERSRSAVWPLVLALIVGIAIGFAAGYGAGSREQPAPAAITAAAGPDVAPVPAGKEFTEAAVAPAPAPALPPSPSSELRAQNAEPKNLQSAISNPKSPVAEGRLLVRSTPAGARVSVDGKNYGRTPVAVRDLARGTHRVRISRDGYVTEERRIVITASRPASTMTVALNRSRGVQPAAAPAGRFTGALAVDSRPAGAKVYMDGRLVGTTPMTLPSVAAGSHAIRLEHDGYRRWSSSVRVVASQQNRVTASLER